MNCKVNDCQKTLLEGKIEKLREALKVASEKLTIYRSATDGSYTGGMEYTQLMYLIEAALAEH